MCGIVGYSGEQQASEILLDGLERLEYRGYDSAGIAVISPEGELQIRKTKGRLKVLKSLTDNGRVFNGSTGIGHTRWATHGEPSDVNSHPHLGDRNTIAVVHNGIIENYAEIKEYLISKGKVFSSETDTEVIAQLMEYYYEKERDLMASVYKTISNIKGAYALGILCRDYPDVLIAARKDAPLLLGYSDKGHFIASDVTALLKYTREVSYMDDGEVAFIRKDRIEVFDEFGAPVEKEHHYIDWDVSAAEKQGYPHFMFKEIMEQPEAARSTIVPRISSGRIAFENFSLSDEYLKSINKIVIVACGSSYHVGMVGKYTLERLIKMPISVSLASEFRYADPLIDENALIIAISQSGETLDTMEAIREAKRHGSKILSIVNVKGSSIVRESDEVIYTLAGPEIAVATTKAYSTQLIVLNMFGIYLAELLGTIEKEEYIQLIAELRALPDKMSAVLEDTERIKLYASRYFNQESIFYIGRNIDYALGLEGGLKLKEISYIHSESYAAGELKHGTISLIDNGTLVMAVGTYGKLLEKTISNILEVKTRGADVIALTTDSHREAMEKAADMVITVPEAPVILLPSLGIIPLQLFAYYVALMRGCDIDKPRNLAKSVTVE
ncbi:MAG: glutamine--fructose-6-phosphate transaminase (isomerizing) [Lachnospiraceae bacterium]|nr:glutamine--fructose-6-phosphate transaminase (isomerizing) [Lachnospiraceae bacterium]